MTSTPPTVVPEVKPRPPRRSTVLRLIGMLKPWRRWIILNNALVILGSILGVVSLVAVFPLLQVVFQDGSAPPAAPVAEIASVSTTGDIGFFESLGNRKDRMIAEFERRAAVDPLGTVRLVCLVLIGAALLRVLVQVGSGLCMAYVETRFLRELTRTLYLHILHHDMVFHAWFPIGKLLSRLTVDMNRLQTLIQLVYGTRIREPITLASLTILLFAIDAKLALAAIVTLPILVLPGLALARKVRVVSGKEIGEDASMLELLEEQLSGVALIKSHHAEARESSRFRDESERVFDRRRQRSVLVAVTDPLSELGATVLIVALILLGVVVVYERDWVEGATFLFFLITLSQFYRPLKKLLKLNVTLQRPLMAAKAIFKTLDVEPRMVESADAKPFPSGFNEIGLDEVWFKYGSKEHCPWVLRDLHLTIRRGELVAMLGHNGSGKTTAALLLARFYDPLAGAVTVEGVDLRQIRQSELRRSVGLAHQDAIIFDLTVAENIAFGVHPDEIDTDRVRKAASRVGIEDWVEQLPQGLDTCLGRRGERLSGGQRQLIALARVLYFDSPIIIYDEPIQYLDPLAMQRISRLIAGLKGSKTILMITHSLELAEMADRRVVLSNGSIVADSGRDDLDRLLLLDHLRSEAS